MISFSSDLNGFGYRRESTSVKNFRCFFFFLRSVCQQEKSFFVLLKLWAKILLSPEQQYTWENVWGTRAVAADSGTTWGTRKSEKPQKGSLAASAFLTGFFSFFTSGTNLWLIVLTAG